MNIVVVGQGAIGLLYYTLLSQSGHHNISLLPSTRCPTLPKSFTFTSFDQVISSIQLMQANEKSIANCDLLISCVKSYQVYNALTPLMTVLPANAAIILCHNGMGVYEELPKPIKTTHPILAMLCTHGSKKSNDFSVEHTGIGHSDIGCINKSQHSFLHQEFLEVIDGGLGEFFWHNNIATAQWTKLAINSVINPITALKNITNGDILLPKYSSKIEVILKELVDVSLIEGFKFNENELREIVNNVAEKTALNSSSMRCDLLARRQTEINYINGYVHRLGLKHGIATPENTQLWKEISNHEKHTH